MNRFAALDSFRGLTIALMILVNTPGSWSYVYPALRHAQWHGWTPTDLVFPFFIFILGSAMYFSLGRRDLAPSLSLLMSVTKRSVLLFLIGLLLNLLSGNGDFSTLRIMGVLQRLAVVYFFSALIIICCSTQIRLIIVSVSLCTYSLLLIFIGDLSIDNNPVQNVDLLFLGPDHMWAIGNIAFEPEGILSSVPAVGSAVLGYEITRLIVNRRNNSRTKRQLYSTVPLLFGACFIFQFFLPINKSMWTPSFVFFSTGVATLVLLAFIEIQKRQLFKQAMWILEIYGKNPLFIYVLSWIWVIVYSFIVIERNSTHSNLHDYLFNSLSLFMSPYSASLLFAVVHVAVFWGICWVLYRLNITIRL